MTDSSQPRNAGENKINHSIVKNGGHDCLQCKVIGTVTFLGISGYASYLRIATPKADKRQRLFLACFAIGSGVMALYRTTF